MGDTCLKMSFNDNMGGKMISTTRSGYILLVCDMTIAFTIHRKVCVPWLPNIWTHSRSYSAQAATSRTTLNRICEMVWYFLWSTDVQSITVHRPQKNFPSSLSMKKTGLYMIAYIFTWKTAHKKLRRVNSWRKKSWNLPLRVKPEVCAHWLFTWY